MNWDQVEGKWKQMRGSVKQKWARLTDNDLDYMAGGREQFIGKLQERYGIIREDAEVQAEAWLKTVGDAIMRSEAGRQRETFRSGSAA